MEQAKSVRKRVWKTAQGEEKTAWIITYRDARSERCQETFAQKKTADARHAEVATALRAGTHVAPSKSLTVAEAGESWLRAATANGLEKSTRKTYVAIASSYRALCQAPEAIRVKSQGH